MSVRAARCQLLTLLCLLLALPKPASAQSPEQSQRRALQTAMKNVMYHYSELIAVHIFRLEGELLPTKPGSVVIFDDKNSFTLAINSAEIAISCGALAQVLNQNVFSFTDAPIKDLSLESKGSQLIIRGKFHQKGNVSFEMMATLSATDTGRIRLHADHIKAAHLPVKGILDLLGIDLAGLINTNKVRGISVEKDDLILDPDQILPSPRIQGKVTAIRIEGNDIVQVFGARPAPSFAARQSGNYMAFRHGDMRFGKLTMHDADLILIDMDPRDPLNFYLDRYQDQLVAGYTKSTPEYGLRAYVRDYNKLRKRSSGTQSKGQP